MPRPSPTALLRACSVLLLAGGTVVLSASPTAAEEAPTDVSELSSDEKKRVQQHVEAGKRAYDSGNFEKSLHEFRRAYDLLHHPDFMYRIALAHDRLGHLEEAVSSYRKFLEMAPETDDRAQIERTIEELEDRLERTSPAIEVDTHPSGADVFVGDEEEPRGVTDLELDVDPGRHDLLILKDGFVPMERTVSVERGQTVTLDVELTPRETPDDDEGSTQTVSTGPPVGPIVLISLSAASAIATTVGGLRYHNLNNRADRLRQEGKREEFDRVATQTLTWRNIAIITGSVTAITAGTAILWLSLRSDSGGGQASHRRPVVAPYATLRGAGVRLRF